MTASILLIDDDEFRAERVKPVLAREGYRLGHFAPSLDAIRKMLIDKPDLVVLGLDPVQEGWVFYHKVLTFLESPLLLLLSSGDESDRVKGLRLGADDCMSQPLILTELVARVQALLRRSALDSEQEKGSFTNSNLVVDLDRREVLLDGEVVPLTRIEFRLLSSLVRHAGETLLYEELLAQVWGPNHTRSRDHLKPHIYHLRQKLESDPSRPQRIMTHRGQGYMFATQT